MYTFYIKMYQIKISDTFNNLKLINNFDMNSQSGKGMYYSGDPWSSTGKTKITNM